MIRERQGALDTFFAQTFGLNGHHDPAPPRPNGTVSPPLADAEVLEKARAARNGAAFDRLFLAGDTSEHGDDDSAADLALCSHLAFWTQDRDQIDRLVRRSGLMRPKWERTDYRDRTVAKALERGE
ncbi:MAG: hypothetical protein M3Q10_18460, partial [Chloroflexota bacterium]|nr:hypothetical protein [Chloroflexota bacterium]